MTVPPAQRKPSPNPEPLPLFCWVVPWKNSTLAMGSPPAFSTTVSPLRLGLPVARSVEPTPNEFKQPDCEAVVLLLAHGQAVCGATPSPMQKIVPVAAGPQASANRRRWKLANGFGGVGPK